jgi:23S rRNA (guanosine2251-2'-O)-methyltransferase
MYIIKGKHAVLEALKTEQPIDSIRVAHSAQQHPEVKVILQLAREASVRVLVVTASELDKQAGESNTQGILAYVHSRKQLTLEELIAMEFPVLLAVDHIEDSFNFGAILRSAELFGVKGVIYPKDRNTTLTAGVVKAASGAVHHLDLVKVANVGNSLDRLKSKGYWVYSTDVETGHPLPGFEPNFPMVLVVGNEGKGVSSRVKKIADQNLHIPTVGHLDSLNVSVATGIILYHISQFLPGTHA